MMIQPDSNVLDNLSELLVLAKAEDLGDVDITSSLFDGDIQVTGEFVAKETLIVCGSSLLEHIASKYDPAIRTNVLVLDGEEASVGKVIANWSGPVRAILSAERVALNFLQRLSGIATLTKQYVRTITGTNAKIYDTRKTTPGWRALEKYAVRTGGGCNHRMGLYDAVLVKDNHLALLTGTGTDAMKKLSDMLAVSSDRLETCDFVELEVDNLQWLQEALKLPVDVILLDNMSVQQMHQAVKMRNEEQSERIIELEASGGITLENLRNIAETAVERISVGALTHSPRAVDIALEMNLD